MFLIASMGIGRCDERLPKVSEGTIRDGYLKHAINENRNSVAGGACWCNARSLSQMGLCAVPKNDGKAEQAGDDGTSSYEDRGGINLAEPEAVALYEKGLDGEQKERSFIDRGETISDIIVGPATASAIVERCNQVAERAIKEALQRNQQLEVSGSRMLTRIRDIQISGGERLFVYVIGWKPLDELRIYLVRLLLLWETGRAEIAECQVYLHHREKIHVGTSDIERSVRKGKAIVTTTIRNSDDEKPIVIKPRDRVMIVARSNSLNVSLVGEALDSGRVGQMIRVRNPISQKILVGKIVREGLVEVLF